MVTLTLKVSLCIQENTYPYSFDYGWHNRKRSPETFAEKKASEKQKFGRLLRPENSLSHAFLKYFYPQYSSVFGINYKVPPCKESLTS